MLAIMSGVGGADSLGQAHADGPQCIANATDQCPQQADLARAEPPRADPPQAHRPQLRTVCTGGGPFSGGAHCWQVPAPSINLQP